MRQKIQDVDTMSEYRVTGIDITPLLTVNIFLMKKLALVAHKHTPLWKDYHSCIGRIFLS